VKKVVDVEDQRNLFREVPDEILLLIFYAAIPHRSYLMHLYPRVPTRLGVSPCGRRDRSSRFAGVGIEMFYKEVVFRQFGQIHALVRTLENSMVDMGGSNQKNQHSVLHSRWLLLSL